MWEWAWKRGTCTITWKIRWQKILSSWCLIVAIVFVVYFSDGRVKYTFNKNSVKIEIPLPLGGISSKDLKMLETIRTPVISLPFLGFYQAPQEFQLPSFTIPKLYELRVPHLGVLDLSTNIYSNLYNWSASYTGGNTSTDHFSLQARYHMKADSAVDLLSYSVQGGSCLGRGCTGLIHCRLWWDSLLQGEKDLGFLKIFFLLLGYLFIHSFIQPIKIFIKHIKYTK